MRYVEGYAHYPSFQWPFIENPLHGRHFSHKGCAGEHQENILFIARRDNKHVNKYTNKVISESDEY